MAFRSEDLAGMVVSAIFFMIPIVAILTRHQQKMAALYSQQRQPDHQNELVHEIRMLRQTVAEQSLVLDDVANRQRELAARVEASETLQKRLEA